MSDKFMKHPSERLQEIFAKRPFQIQEPEKARIIFLGLDANFDYNLEEHPLFEDFIDFIKNGTEYWKREKIHTPMLKSNYTGMGKKYHEKFQKLGFDPENAEDICFLELLNVCTCGKSTENIKAFRILLLSKSNQLHLQRIARLAADKTKQIYICGNDAANFIQELHLFDLNSPNIFLGKHFSGSVSNAYFSDISKLLKNFLMTGNYIPKQLENHTHTFIKKESPKTINSKKTKDYTKYIFKGQKYGKGRLVLAVLTDYVRNNQSITLPELKRIFPDEIQYDSFMNQKYGIIQTESLVREKNWNKHFFNRNEEKIILSDTSILVSKEWGINNITQFLRAADKAGIKIQKDILN